MIKWVGLSIDIENRSNLTSEFEAGAGEAAAHIMAAASIIKGLGEWSLQVSETVRKYVDNWILTLVPLTYVPGMAEAVGSRLKRPIFDIFDEVGEEELATTLELVTEVKRSLDEGNVPYNFPEMEVRVERVMRALGLDVNEFGGFLEASGIIIKMQRMVTLFAIVVGISSVWDRQWIAESQ
ncbi:hypothetical protein MetMK1DRAFT_00011800 [Metallosphaera yellowstonensis MK1]|uniref:Uncharacterized protein n=1 Tax=Metallosphaera yellowstonensis MK1 TaxID=671065 RepID=H2C356_9CREN|nr:hypothetical protein [Metallosphaera yellowstonensis]EHP70677.1 hypothetical protein MetMK1DRAFT_00011800 [Metallosphaera yellowstonensis MK1]